MKKKYKKPELSSGKYKVVIKTPICPICGDRREHVILSGGRLLLWKSGYPGQVFSTFLEDLDFQFEI